MKQLESTGFKKYLKRTTKRTIVGLDKDKAAAIRFMFNEEIASQRLMARFFEVDKKSIGDVVHNRSYRDVLQAHNQWVDKLMGGWEKWNVKSSK